MNRDTLEQEPSGDLISREETLTAFADYVGSGMSMDDYDALWDIVAKMPPVNPQPCEDAISREWLKTAMHNFYYGLKHTPTEEDIQAYIDAAPLVTPQPKTGHCRDCKWWKDSDGSYCRGVHAESKCPINRKEVYEGNGYCYMFEPQERSDKE